MASPRSGEGADGRAGEWGRNPVRGSTTSGKLRFVKRAYIKSNIRRAVPEKLLWRFGSVRAAYAGGHGPNANFGDQLTPLLIERLFGVRVKNSRSATSELVAVGSILENMSNAERSPYVWGTGFIREGGQYSGKRLRIKAVRGQLSLARVGQLVGDSHVALGDPGILAAEAFPEFQGLPKRNKIGIVPHFTDFDSPQLAKFRNGNGVEVINPRSPAARVIRRIVESEVVLSSSLHGLVVADSFGIPNFWTPMGSGLIGGRYKFDDYYSAFGKVAVSAELAESIQNADARASLWRPHAEILPVKEGLLAAFPWPVESKVTLYVPGAEG